MAASKTSASGQGRSRKPVVFLVDDEPALLDLLEISLKKDGYTLRKFLDPEEALRAFLASPARPDVLVTDYALGKMDGLQLIERCQEAKPDLLSVMVSGTASAEIVLNSLVKVNRFLGKPYQPSSLSDLVRSLIAENLDKTG